MSNRVRRETKMHAAWGWALLGIALVVLVYARAVRGDFLWDDDAHITNNPTVIGPQGLREIWTTPAANYFPLTMTSFRLVHAIWGLSPVPYHVVSILFHAASAIVLWSILRRLAIPGAWVGAMLWALHPVQTESVAWICELKNTQSGFFYLFAILAFVRWVQRQRGDLAWSAEYGFALLCSAAAVLSKTSTVMLPVVLAGIGVALGRRKLREGLFLIPFFAVSLVASAWTIWEQRVHSMASGADWDLPMVERLLIAGKVIWFYLGKLLWPHPLIFIYPRWGPAAHSVAGWLPLLLIVLAAAALWRWRSKGPVRVTGIAALYFVVSLFPVLGFFNVFFFRYSYVSDHFQYVASIGPLVLLGAFLHGVSAQVRATGSRWAGLALTTVPLVVLGGLTWRQTGVYQNVEALWRHTARLNPAASIALVNLGSHLVSAGRPAEGIPYLEAELRAKPDDFAAEMNLGVALVTLDRPNDAVPHLARAIELKPELAEAHNALGVAKFRLGHVTEALPCYELALRLRPEFREAKGNLANAENNLGVALFQTGDARSAAEHFRRATLLAPDYAIARANLGSALLATNDVSGAIEQLQQALLSIPARADVRMNLARAWVARGQPAEAARECEEVLRLAPGFKAAEELRQRLQAPR